MNDDNDATPTSVLIDIADELHEIALQAETANLIAYADLVRKTIVHMRDEDERAPRLAEVAAIGARVREALGL